MKERKRERVCESESERKRERECVCVCERERDKSSIKKLVFWNNQCTQNSTAVPSASKILYNSAAI